VREGLEGLIEPEQRRQGPNLTEEIRATLIDHVINHRLTLMEAGQIDQPNLSIIFAFIVVFLQSQSVCM